MNDEIELRTLGGLIGDLCEDAFINTKGMRPADLDALMTDIASSAAIALDDDPMFTMLTPDQERGIYRELAKRFLVRFEVDDSEQAATKRCSGCGRELSLTDFYLRRRDHPTRQSRCKDCVSAYLVQYRLVPRNGEDIP